MSERNNAANDYAIALCLNKRVWRILWDVADLYPLQDKDLDKINRNYIFLVQELTEIYAHNKELQGIEPKPVWQRYKHIEGNEVSIAELQDDRTGDTGQNHTAAVKRLCIIQGKEEPDLNARQKELVTEADEIVEVLHNHAEEERKHLRALQQKYLESTRPENLDSTPYPQVQDEQIVKLSLVKKNLKFKLNSTTYTFKQFASTKNFNYKLMKFLLDRPDEWVSQNDIKHFKIRSKAKDWPKIMGFTGELKDIFFDVDTKEQKIMLNSQKSLTPDEAEILKSIVKTLKTK